METWWLLMIHWHWKLDANDNNNLTTTFRQLSASTTLVTVISDCWLLRKSKKQQPATNQSTTNMVILSSQRPTNLSRTFHNPRRPWKPHPTAKQTPQSSPVTIDCRILLRLIALISISKEKYELELVTSKRETRIFQREKKQQISIDNDEHQFPYTYIYKR